MKRLLFVAALLAGIQACDDGVSGPDETPLVVNATVTSEEGAEIGAVLLAVEGSVEWVRKGVGGQALSRAETDRVVVAVVSSPAQSTVRFEMSIPAGSMPAGSMPTVEILQAADGANELYENPGGFTVELVDAESVP